MSYLNSKLGVVVLGLTQADDAGQTHSRELTTGSLQLRHHRMDPALDHSHRELHERVGARGRRPHLPHGAVKRRRKARRMTNDN